MSTGAFYTNVFPNPTRSEADADAAVAGAAHERRARAHQQDLGREGRNMFYLARIVENQPFHLYVNKQISTPDSRALKIRITPVYRDFFGRDGRDADADRAGRGLHRARARRRRRLLAAGRSAASSTSTGRKRRSTASTRLLRRRSARSIVNLKKWQSLSAKQREFLQRQALAFGGRNDFRGRRTAQEEIKRQAAGRHPDVIRF